MAETYIINGKHFKYYAAGGLQKPYNIEGKCNLYGDTIIFYFNDYEKKINLLTPAVIEKTIVSNHTTIKLFFTTQNGETFPSKFQNVLINREIYLQADENGAIQTKLNVIQSIQPFDAVLYNSIEVKDSLSNYFEVFIKILPVDGDYSITKTITRMVNYNDSLFDGNRSYFLVK